jgi:hypothetical protein
MTSFWAIAYFLLLVVFLVYKTPTVHGPWLFLLRSFFPNWKFFHAVGYVPHLYARAAMPRPDGRLQWTDWQHLYPRRPQNGWHLFYNPETNLALAQQNMVDHFWADLNDLPETQDPRLLVSYQMISHFVEAYLLEKFPDFTHHQFELRMLTDSPTETVHTHVMMTSPVVSKA